jgi:sensor histidine kinase YesM
MKKYLEPFFHVVFWVTTYLIFKSFLHQSVKETTRIVNDKIVNHTIEKAPAAFFLPGMLFKILFCYGITFLVYPAWLKRRSVGLLTITIFAAAIFLFWIEYVFHSVVYNFSFTDFESFLPRSILSTNVPLYLFYSGVLIAYILIKEGRIIQLLRFRSKEEQYKSDIRFLKAQVNPHFLFNTLNNLYSVAQKNNDDETAEGISKLSGMMRFMLYDTNTDEIPLSKELEYIGNFIELQKLRYEKGELDMQFELLINSSNMRIAPLILIPFVENAFKHSYRPGGTSVIKLNVTAQSGILYFNVMNNIGKNAAEDINESGVGLENVKSRLRLLYPGKHKLEINGSEDMFTVSLKVELI